MTFLTLLDPASDHPVEDWTTEPTAWSWRAEQPWRTYFDYKFSLIECEGAGPQMRPHP